MYALIAAAVAIGAAGIAELLDTSDEEARKQRLAALQEYAALQSPEVRQLIAQGVKESAYSRIRANEGQRAIQDEAQQRLLSKGRANGLDLQARASLEEAALTTGQQARQQREGVLQNARARGTAGSGEELMAQLSAEQSGADSMRMAGVRAAADADEAAINAMINAGNMAGQREEREWNQDAQVASAEDEIAMFNAGENNKFTIYNDQQRWNKADYDLRLAQGRANARTGYANAIQEEGARDKAAIGGAGQGAAYGIASYGDYKAGTAPGQTTSPVVPSAPQVIQTKQPIAGGGVKKPSNQQTAATSRRAR